MSSEAWPQRPLPDPGPVASPMWAGPDTLADLTTLRRRLRAAVTSGMAPTCSDEDDLDRLLLVFEELASNALRHGSAPVRVAVTPTCVGWLLDISDAAADRPPTPDVGRDPAYGGLGLQLVARLAPAHGWQLDGDRKRVWAHLICTAAGPDDRVVGEPCDTATDLTARPAPRLSASPGPRSACGKTWSPIWSAWRQESPIDVGRHARSRGSGEHHGNYGAVTPQGEDDGVRP